MSLLNRLLCLNSSSILLQLIVLNASCRGSISSHHLLNHCALKRTDSDGLLLEAGGLRPADAEFVVIVFMVFDVVFNHIAGHVPGADREESSRPQVLPPNAACRAAGIPAGACGRSCLS